MTLARAALASIALLAVLPLAIAATCAGDEGWGAAFGEGLAADLAVGEDIFAVIEDDGQLHLSRIEIDNGTQVWRVPLPVGTPGLSPALAGNTVICAHGTGVYGFNATNGLALWNLSIPQTVAPVSDGALLVMSNGSAVMGYSAFGRPSPVWASPVSTATYLALDGESVYVGTGARSFEVLDASNGSKRWGFEASEDLAGRPASSGGRTLIVEVNGNVSMLDSRGNVLERRDTGATRCSPMALGGEYLLGFENGSVVRLDHGLFTRWNASAGAPVLDLVVSGSLVHAISADGRVAAMDADSGDVAWDADYWPSAGGSAGPGGGIVIWSPDGRVSRVQGTPAPCPYLVQGGLFLTSDPPLQGKKVRVFALLRNRGSGPGTFEVAFIVDGRELVRDTLTVGSASTASATAWWKPDRGEHVVTVEVRGGWNASAEGGRAMIVVKVVGEAEGRDLRAIVALVIGFIALWCLMITIAIIYSKAVLGKRARRAGANERKGR
ncbi:MAG: PQQ-like beta-propeller repeat protein [Thermoplasmata archaeon]|nr:PQQ-like beta-propeller repeat protein [Thermoplasmata archaeon]